MSGVIFFGIKRFKSYEKALAAPEIALDTAIYLNDKYALDAPSPNGYAGILWSIGGLHDRPFANRPIIGKIRPMSGQKIKY
ncbi:MAG: hypothetical protein LUB59_01595 [Candidatus Gastranaerophilales bacterium]|nr:hypothetical protein [Candidatus Gastranaerophilales bacterium]